MMTSPRIQPISSPALIFGPKVSRKIWVCQWRTLVIKASEVNTSTQRGAENMTDHPVTFCPQGHTFLSERCTRRATNNPSLCEASAQSPGSHPPDEKDSPRHRILP